MAVQENEVRPLRWLSEQQQARLCDLVLASLRAVITEWRCGNELYDASWKFSMADSVMPASSAWYEITSNAGELLAIHLQPDSLRQLINLPISSRVPSDDNKALLVTLERDFIEAVVRKLLPQLLQSGLTIRIDDHGNFNKLRHSQHILSLSSERQTNLGYFVMQGCLVDQLLPREKAAKVKVDSRRSGIGDQLLSVTARIGQVELPFSALRTLALGDVLVLDSGFSEPVTLHNDVGQQIASGALGCQDQQRALLVTRVASERESHVNALKRSGG